MADNAGIHLRIAELATLAESLAQAAQERRVSQRNVQEPSVDAIARVLARDLAALRDDVEHIALGEIAKSHPSHRDA